MDKKLLILKNKYPADKMEEYIIWKNSNMLVTDIFWDNKEQEELISLWYKESDINSLINDIKENKVITIPISELYTRNETYTFYHIFFNEESWQLMFDKYISNWSVSIPWNKTNLNLKRLFEKEIITKDWLDLLLEIEKKLKSK